MNDELVEKLRRCGKGLCTEDCPDWTNSNLYHTCQDEVVLEAADAIEELQKRLEHSIPRPFTVIDTKTGEYPDLWDIALHEDWAKGLMYCDMEGFAIEEDGTLWLLDECGRMAACPEGRFKIVPEEEDDADS